MIKLSPVIPLPGEGRAKFQPIYIRDWLQCLMGLWPPDLDLAERMAGTIGTEAVGLYIPEERALYVVRDPAIPWRLRVLSALARRDLAREYALAHELVHYLQHTAYPDLFAAVLGLKHSDDAAWAGQTAIEGDAVRYGFAALGSSVPVPTAVDFQAELEKADADKPEQAEIWYWKGQVYQRTNRFKEAILAYHHAIQIKPDYAEAWENIATTMTSLGRNQDAVNALDKARKITESRTQK